MLDTIPVVCRSGSTRADLFQSGSVGSELVSNNLLSSAMLSHCFL
ncbi:hypothetical protein SAMN05216236_1071, partial [Sedimentitalea nanhaiensis]